MSNQIVLIEITGYNTLTLAVETLRFCDGLAYRTRPSETPANTLYRPFVLDPGWTRVDVFTKPGQYGHVTPGQVVLDDSSGTLGAQLINYAFDGRAIVIRIGDRGAAYPSGYTTLFNGTMDMPPAFSYGKITFHPVDLTASLKRPLQSQRYAGNNVLPDGLEGGADLAGKVKPIAFGYEWNISPVLVNTAKLIYQVSTYTGVVVTPAGSANVRDKGVPLNYSGTSYASIGELLDDSLAPAAGYFKDFSDLENGSFFRLGSPPVGQVTCDVLQSGTVDHATAWGRLLSYAGVPSPSVSSYDIVIYNLPGSGGDANANISCAFFTDTDFFTELTKIATSAGSSWFGDESGVHRFQRWKAPSGSPVATLTELRTDTIDISDPIGDGEVAPAYEIALRYYHNWTVQQDANLGGDKTSPSDTVRAGATLAGLAARAWLATEWHPIVSPVALPVPLFIASATADSLTASVTVNKPTGTVNGHAMIAVVLTQGAAVTVPSGWTPVTSATPPAGFLTCIYKKIAASEPANYTFTGTGSAETSAMIATYSNLSTSIIDRIGAWFNVNSVANLVASSVTPENANEIVLAINTTRSATTITRPSGMTRRAIVSGTFLTCSIEDQIYSASQATGTKTSVLGSSTNGGASILLSLTPNVAAISATKAAYLGAISLQPPPSLLWVSDDAQAYANDQLTLYGTARRMVTTSQWLSAAQIAVIRPGTVVTLKSPRWGMSAGRLMRVAGIKIDRGTGKTELSLWG